MIFDGPLKDRDGTAFDRDESRKDLKGVNGSPINDDFEVLIWLQVQTMTKLIDEATGEDFFGALERKSFIVGETESAFEVMAESYRSLEAASDFGKNQATRGKNAADDLRESELLRRK